MKNFDPQYNDLPKTEIHCHLEGAIRTATIIDFARQYHLPLPSYEVAALDKHVKVLEQLRNLEAVLEAFGIARNCFVAADVVERVAWELFEDSARQNIKLFEVRFSPDWAFSHNGLDWDAALEGLLRARYRAERELGMAIGLIAITSRSLGPASCVRTVDWAIRHTGNIHGIDLADSERDFPLAEFLTPIRKAREAGLKVTIHTGEDTPASFVTEVIRLAEPDRIGHGIHIIEDPAALDLVRERGITLEVNPWSNYLTNSVARIEEHPLKRLFDLGVRVTINSDDPEVLDTNLNNEYRIAHEVLGMTFDEIAACNRVCLCRVVHTGGSRAKDSGSVFRRWSQRPRRTKAIAKDGPGKPGSIMPRARFPATVHLLFFRDEKILLLRRFQTGYRDGEYSVPAGHLDGNETVRAAALREAAEEVGVKIQPDDLLFSSVMHRNEGDERVDFFVIVRAWQGEPFNNEPHKCDELRWEDVKSLPANMIPYVRRAIENEQSGVHFDEFGWPAPQ